MNHKAYELHNFYQYYTEEVCLSSIIIVLKAYSTRTDFKAILYEIISMFLRSRILAPGKSIIHGNERQSVTCIQKM